MTDGVKIPPLPEAIWPYNVGFPTFTTDQMRAFYLQGYNHGLNTPRVLGAGLDPWPNSGDPAIADALRAPDDAIPSERKPLTDEQPSSMFPLLSGESIAATTTELTDEQITALIVVTMPGDPYSEVDIIATARAILAASKETSK